MAIPVHRLGNACGGFYWYLTVTVRTFAEMAEYTQDLQDNGLDKSGSNVEIIHKGAKAQRPAKVSRRGVAVAPVYKELGKALVAGETLKQTHADKVVKGVTKDTKASVRKQLV